MQKNGSDSKMNRKQERKEALYLIFELNFHKDETANDLFENAAELRDLVITDYIRKTVTGVEENIAKIDILIEKYLKNWKLTRLSAITLSILRLAVFEMLYNEDIPENIAINEAIELAKEFDADDMPAFINGVLGNISRNKE